METVRKTFIFPKVLVDAIVQYQKENMLPTLTASVHELIRKGLNSSRKGEKNG